MLLTKNDFKIDQIVACKHAGNKARYDKGYTLGKVKSVGKKYVTVSFSDVGKGIQFTLEDSFERDYLIQKSNTIGDYELFPSEQAYLDYEEKNRKIDEIETKAFPRYGQSNLTIDQVRRIYEIVNE
ncbi:beta barrel domain-containing protein [Cytobacillus gottheilii]|uniref:beta barrel domain-containing protein n=1 Tax=Cytobacillus gottheilii TaxID=859144 RepID=UPI0009BAF0A2|nr:hypothetical protein [Cytobacillus gottheilii]